MSRGLLDSLLNTPDTVNALGARLARHPFPRIDYQRVFVFHRFCVASEADMISVPAEGAGLSGLMSLLLTLITSQWMSQGSQLAPE